LHRGGATREKEKTLKQPQATLLLVTMTGGLLGCGEARPVPTDSEQVTLQACLSVPPSQMLVSAPDLGCELDVVIAPGSDCSEPGAGGALRTCGSLLADLVPGLELSMATPARAAHLSGQYQATRVCQPVDKLSRTVSCQEQEVFIPSSLVIE